MCATCDGMQPNIRLGVESGAHAAAKLYADMNWYINIGIDTFNSAIAIHFICIKSLRLSLCRHRRCQCLVWIKDCFGCTENTKHASTEWIQNYFVLFYECETCFWLATAAAAAPTTVNVGAQNLFAFFIFTRSSLLFPIMKRE